MSEQPITIEARGGIEVVSLNRPDRLNTMNEPLIAALLDYFTGLRDRQSVRVVVLRAEGRAFCAGLDLTGWAPDPDAGPIRQSWRTQRMIAAVMQAMRKCPQPVIVAAQGPACGGGFSLLLASDVRYGAPDLRMNAAYIKIGLGGCDMGASYFLPRLVGSSVASEYLLTGKFMSAEKALACGLISEIVPHDALLDKALALAEEMLLTSPMGLRLTKDALNLNIDAASMEHAFALEDRQQVMLGQAGDFAEAKAAFFEKRPPNWQDR
ncbi:enoyl-CoA hydratase/isomerase family protein [Novosphingobium sp.]|uniref:enoyl-CoA hydratase/isomerase family protein n=1 Tax=Novosphingobium sp. TaxID=1874826 RepID=UPI0025D9FE68|nr:enoyl-CoA hydratase/isomerase family protein [Novosphingobium sp.]MCC6926891.1 enoyl-CoA hydratase/isomerase family protein [Novosphingobium sp.]